VANGANIEGRLLAQTGQVTLINDTITAPVCTVTSGGGSTSVTPSVTPKLPNTGSESEQNTASLWAIGISSGIIITLLSLVIVQRKRAI
jgi:LPXTG-motif cell wall-anchored protein